MRQLDEQTQALLAEYIDGYISADDRVRIEKLLESDPALARAVQASMIDSERLRAMPQMECPVDLSEPMHARLERDALLSTEPMGPTQRRFVAPWIAMAATLGLTAGLSALVWWVMSARPGVDSTIATNQPVAVSQPAEVQPPAAQPTTAQPTAAQPTGSMEESAAFGAATQPDLHRSDADAPARMRDTDATAGMEDARREASDLAVAAEPLSSNTFAYAGASNTQVLPIDKLPGELQTLIDSPVDANLRQSTTNRAVLLVDAGDIAFAERVLNEELMRQGILLSPYPFTQVYDNARNNFAPLGRALQKTNQLNVGPEQPELEQRVFVLNNVSPEQVASFNANIGGNQFNRQQLFVPQENVELAQVQLQQQARSSSKGELANLATADSQEAGAASDEVTRPARVAERSALQPGDELEIVLTDDDAFGVRTTKRLKVDPQASIELPGIGKISTKDKTLLQLQEAVSVAYRDQKLSQNMKVEARLIPQIQDESPEAARNQLEAKRIQSEANRVQPGAQRGPEVGETRAENVDLVVVLQAPVVQERQAEPAPAKAQDTEANPD